MIENLWIDDAYIRENYPLPINVDADVMKGCIKMAQASKMRSYLGECLYLHMEDGVTNQNLTGDFAVLFPKLQYLLLFYSVAEMADFVRTENTVTGKWDRNQVMQSAEDKYDYFESECGKFIVDSTDIMAVANADDCTDKFKYNTTGSSGIFYPSIGSTSDCG
jgi:hypothetical protein